MPGRLRAPRRRGVRAQRGGEAPRGVGGHVEVSGTQGAHEAARDVERCRVMNCQDYEAQIGDYVDGTLDESQRPALDAHLASCASCRALVDDFTVIRAASLNLEPR